MNEQLQRLASPVSLPALALQIRIHAVPQTARGQLCTIFPGKPGSKAARESTAHAGPLRNDLRPHGGKQARPRRLAPRVPTRVPVSPGQWKDLTPKTTESHWSGDQRDT